MKSKPCFSFNRMFLTLNVVVFLLQALPHVGLLIVMLFFIYAVIGMQVSFPYLVSLSCLNVLFLLSFLL